MEIKMSKINYIKSEYFGSWVMRCNGLEQHDLTPKQFLKHFNSFHNLPADTEVPRDFKRAKLNHLLNTECWYSADGKYKVAKAICKYGDCNFVVHKEGWEIIWLSIRINNGEDHLRDWRDFQEIKNDLAGRNREAVEVYPDENKLVDEVNTYHLWVYPEGFETPMGWTDRSVQEDNGEDQRRI
tara:strand:- start:9449 stop:9997 length:549 start_codon:yes stop_codon:yes gene_type:complete